MFVENEATRRQLAAMAAADAATFLAKSLDEDAGEGVPPPPTIEITEVSADPVKLDFLGFGTQGASTEPGGGGGPPPPPAPTGACCIDGDCSIMSEGQCIANGGVYQGDDTECIPNPCSTCYRITTHNTGYLENHYYYPCSVGCTPDFGDHVSTYDYTRIVHYDSSLPPPSIVSVECSGSRTDYCTGGYGCICPPTPPENQCHWNLDCTQDYVVNSAGTDCELEGTCLPLECNCPEICEHCYECPYGTLVCEDNEDCFDGNDCYVCSDFGGGWCTGGAGLSHCWRSSGFCNDGELMEIEPCS